MRDVDIPPERVQDPFERNVPGRGLGRDPERTPMQWNAERNGGFTTGEPWLASAAPKGEAPHSRLRVCAERTALARAEPALEVGRFEMVATEGDLLAYIRR